MSLLGGRETNAEDEQAKQTEYMTYLLLTH